MTRHPFGNASDKEVFDAAPPMGGNYNQISPLRARMFYNLKMHWAMWLLNGKKRLNSSQMLLHKALKLAFHLLNELLLDIHIRIDGKFQGTNHRRLSGILNYG